MPIHISPRPKSIWLHKRTGSYCVCTPSSLMFFHNRPRFTWHRSCLSMKTLEMLCHVGKKGHCHPGKRHPHPGRNSSRLHYVPARKTECLHCCDSTQDAKRDHLAAMGASIDAAALEKSLLFVRQICKAESQANTLTGRAHAACAHMQFFFSRLTNK